MGMYRDNSNPWGGFEDAASGNAMAGSWGAGNGFGSALQVGSNATTASNGWQAPAGTQGSYAGGLVNPGGAVAGGTANALGTAQNDFRQALQGGQAGQTINWGGGQLTYDGNGGATFNGQHVDANTDLGSLASQNQGVMSVLNGYGYGGNNDVSAQTYGWQGIQPGTGGASGGAPAGGAGGGSAGGATYQGMGGATFGNAGSGGTSNPYLGDQVNYLRQNAQENYDRITAPQIRYGMAAGGGYGGSRMGVLEANAQRDMNNGVNGAIANLLGGNWQQDQSRMVASRDNNRGMDLTQMGLAASLFGQGVNGQAGLGQGAYNIGQTEQQAPWTAIGNAANSYSPFTGLGSSQINTSRQGGGLQGLAGGILGGAQIANNLGLFGSGSNAMGNSVYANGGGGFSGSSLGNFFYGNGTSGD